MNNYSLSLSPCMQEDKLSDFQEVVIFNRKLKSWGDISKGFVFVRV